MEAMEDFKLIYDESNVKDEPLDDGEYADSYSSRTEIEADSTTNIASQPQTKPNPKTSYFNNCIILGKKPSKNKNEDHTKKDIKKCHVNLEKIDDFFKYNSNRYCSECKILFRIAKDLNVHKKNVHSYTIEYNNDLNTEAKKDEKTRFSCSYCNVKMATEFGLQKHIHWIHGNIVVTNEPEVTTTVEPEEDNTEYLENEQDKTGSLENGQNNMESVNNMKFAGNLDIKTEPTEKESNTESLENGQNYMKYAGKLYIKTEPTEKESNNTESLENGQYNMDLAGNLDIKTEPMENEPNDMESVEIEQMNTTSVENQQNNMKFVENVDVKIEGKDNQPYNEENAKNKQNKTKAVDNEQNDIDQNNMEFIVNSNIEPELIEESTSSQHFPSEPCSLCHEVFPNKDDLIQHIYKDHLKSFSCEVCSQIFPIKEKYQEHLLTHNNQNNNEERLIYRCFCGCQFSLFKVYANHFRVFHKSHKEKLNITMSKIEFKCKFCPKIFEKLNVYNRHIMHNHNENNNEERLIYRCFCGCQFSLFQLYVNHFRIIHKSHNGKLNMTKSKIEYKCRFCPKISKKLNIYNRHIMQNHNPKLDLEKKLNKNNCGKSVTNKLVAHAELKKNTLFTKTDKSSKSNTSVERTKSYNVDNDKTEVQHVTEDRKTTNKKTDITNDNLMSECKKSYVNNTDTTENNENVEFYFCFTCKTYFAQEKFRLDVHKKFWCLKMPRTMCTICGLHVSSNNKAEHKKLHTESKLTLKDFKFFCASSQQPITPPTPDLPSCRRCKVHFNCKALRNVHEKVCKNNQPIKTRSCQQCHKDFTKKAYLMHMQYHKIQSVNLDKNKLEAIGVANKIIVGKKRYIYHQCQSCKLCVKDPLAHFECAAKLNEKCKHCNLHFDKSHSEVHASILDLNKDTIRIVPFTKIGPQSHLDTNNKKPEYTLYKCRLCQMCVASYALARKHEACNGQCTNRKTRGCDKCGFKFYCRAFAVHYEKHLHFPDMTTENIKIVEFGGERRRKVLSPRRVTRR